MSFSDYPREILKIAIAQICKKLGFEATEQSACETLVDITQQCNWKFLLFRNY